MRYCPNCEVEYIDTIQECPECKVQTISEEEWNKILEVEEEYRKVAKNFVTVKIAPDQFYGEMVKEVLEKEGIPTILRVYRDTAYAGIFEYQMGWGAILVPKELKAKAIKFIEQFDKTQFGSEETQENEGEEDSK